MNTTKYIKTKFNIKDTDPKPYVLKDVHREELYQLFAELGYRVGCEIGLARGKNAQKMFEYIPNLKLFAVDAYKEHPQCSYKATAISRNMDDLYHASVKKQAYNRMQGKNAIIIEKFSEDAVRDIPDNSLDFVYIDGDHSYDFVILDMILWGRKVRKGGIISGHDYYDDKNKSSRRAKVTQAVNDYVRVHGIELYTTNEDHDFMRKDDYYPSWLWVKLEAIYPNVEGA